MLLRWFVRGLSSAEIARETRLNRKRVLRALTIVRRGMMRSVPAGVRRVTTIEVAGPQKSAKRSGLRFAVLGLYAAHGHAWAEVVPQGEAEQLGHALRDRDGRRPVRPGAHRYTAVIYRGRLYRLAESSAGRTPFGQAEAFWAYLQRQLRAKGGIRRERLGLYLAEFSWRYNHRNLSPAEQVRELLTLIRQRN